MVVEITIDTVIIFLAFVVVVFLLYKTFKLLLRASLIVSAAFTFPWIAQYIGLPIRASMDVGLMFALAGFGLFLTYEFFNFIVQFFRILLWPFRKKKVS
jgi:hypothetical protein